MVAGAANSSKVSTDVPSSPVSKHIPAFKAIGNPVLDNKAERSRMAFVETVDIMYHNPDLRRDICDYAKQLLASQSIQSEHGADALQNISTLGKYDEDSMAIYVARKLNITMQALGKAQASDGKLVKRILTAMLNSTMGVAVPDACRRRSVMEASMDSRIVQVGNRHLLLMSPVPLIDTLGNVNWRAGIFDAKPAEGSQLINLVVHRPTGDTAAVPDSYGIDTTWDIADNHDDMSAEFFKSKAQRVKCCDFFARGQGPKKIKQWKGVSDEFQKLADERLQSERAAANGSSTNSSCGTIEEFKQPLKDPRKAASQKGIDKLAERRAEKAKRRRTSLSTSVPVAPKAAI